MFSSLRATLGVVFVVFCVVVAVHPSVTLSQSSSLSDSKSDRFFYKNGMNFVAGDSSFSMNLRFRIQSLAEFRTEQSLDNDLELGEMSWITRRIRLRMNGFAYSPKWTYNIQLSFSRGDMDYDNVAYPNILRDANINYAPTSDLSFLMGLAKLPGNRERVISSGDLQFVDRSLLNATYNIDRDFGFQVRYAPQFEGMQVVAQAAVSTGDGRNVVRFTNTLATTARLAYYPLGAFTNNGDMFLGDLEFEKTPKLYVAGVYHHNPGAIRTGGQIGEFFDASYTGSRLANDSIGRDITTIFVDGMFKYQGFMIYGEWAKRSADNPIVRIGTASARNIVVGTGLNLQASYLLTSHFETAVRYTSIDPNDFIRANTSTQRQRQYTMGLTYYMMRHRIKFQLDITNSRVQQRGLDDYLKQWIVRFQTEFGI
jgi:phosphate-selective porin OprO and OprP